MGVDPKSIYSFSIFKLGNIAVALIGTSIFLEPLITIIAFVSMLHGFAELTLNNISAASSAAILPIFGKGVIIF